MKNLVNCKCGNLHGSVELKNLKLVLNSTRKKDNGMKFQLAYNVAGTFIVDARQNLLRCVDCGEFALTSADWEAVNNPNSSEIPELKK